MKGINITSGRYNAEDEDVAEFNKQSKEKQEELKNALWVFDDETE